MKRLYLILILAVFGISNLAYGQQFPYYYQYLLNKYALSPSYAGLYGIPEAYLSYRQSRIPVEYTPRTINFNLNAPVGEKVGLGLTVMNDKSDIFNNLYAMASYTYHLKVAENHNIDFSLNGGIIQKRIDLSSANKIDDINIFDPNDPLTKGLSEINQTSLDLGGAIMYRYKKLNVGAWVPSFYENNSTFYSFKKHIIGYASYDYKINDIWNIEPIAILRYTENSPINFDISALARYKEKYLAAVTYKRNTILGLSIGGEIVKNVVFMYSYDFPISISEFRGVLGDNYGGHEVTLGYRFGKRAGELGEAPKDDELEKALKGKARVGQVDSLAQLTKQLNDQLKQLADSLDAMKKSKPEVASFSPEIKALEDQIKLLNERLLKTSGAGDQIMEIAKTVYFVTNKSEITRYSERKLDELIDIMKKYPTIRLNVEGHTDAVGTDEYNQRLSEERVASVKAYLIEHGISSDRMTTRAYGESRPVSTNETPEGRQKNRRVEMKGE